MSLVDDYSRRIWVHLVSSKDEAFTKFKDWKVLMKNQASIKVKAPRTHNGLEFVIKNLLSTVKKMAF